MSATFSLGGGAGANAIGRPAARRPRVSAPPPASRAWPAAAHQQRLDGQQARPVAACCTAAASGWRTVESSGEEGEQWDGQWGERRASAINALRALGTPGVAATAWQCSYDEEAAEGCDDDDDSCGGGGMPPAERERWEAARACLSLAACAPRLTDPAPACSVEFLHAGEQQQQQQQQYVGSVAYFAAKPIDQTYDEEAEGCFEEAAAEAAAARAARMASFVERRAEALAASRARRSALRAAPGALEAMAPWVADESASAVAKAVLRAAGRMPRSRYANLAAFLAARTGAMDAVDGIFDALQRERGLQARPVQAWQYTWDEDVHGGGVLSSM